MSVFNLLHSHPLHRARQMRWVIPFAGLLTVAVLVTMGVLYEVANRDVSTEFFRAHKTISHTGQLLQHGVAAGVVVLLLLVIALGIVAFRVTHRIVRPVHTLHLTLEELTAGNLGVRVELHRHDEFQEVAAALNRLVDEFGSTVGKVHEMVDRLETLAHQVATENADVAAAASLHTLAVELNQTMEFFRLQPEQVIRDATV